MTNFDTAFEEVKKLVDDFEKNISHYLNSNYSEAQVRLDFIDKFFIALGWDVRNDNRSNPLHREVVIEKTQKQQQSKAQKRADYAFYVAPDFKNVKLFVEAKKPSRNLKNADDYFQTARYGWNAGIGICILTDFEELHIIDCRFKPDINKVFNAQNKSLHFTDYKDKEKFSELYWLFSKEAVLAGNIEAYVEKLPKPKKGASQTSLFAGKWQSIDESFLEYIDGIRETLAKAFKKNDNNLNSEMLTEAVQRTIDRLVFIRFLEDKLIEPENYVSEFGNRTTTWKDFINTCRILDAKYNGVVFKKHFIDEQNFTGADDIHFKNICNELSHLNTPYDFNAIPIHILGSIYERFLGKVVVVTDKRVKIEEKPEVRKAGGVYYTPKYIVDYIVKNTVGKLIEGRKPVEIAKLKFADIACGSGSFLIGVLECLIDYHTTYYNENKEEAKKAKCLQVDGLYILSIKQKQQILINNIYGVDLDFQAVEVTQVSLYLKMLEDETTATANEMQVLFHEKILPDLSKNIKHGNSLIGTDILTGQLFNYEEEKKLNPFDFESAFPQVFRHGGFDAIIGNPPYVNIENLSEESKKYFFKTYKTCVGRTDIYIPFFEKNLELLKERGLISYIIPYPFINQNYGSALRKLFIENHSVVEIVDTSKYQVFKEAKVKNIILTINKAKDKKETIIKHYESANDFINDEGLKFSINQIDFLKLKESRFETKPIIKYLGLKDKIWADAVPLEKICLIAYGARLNHKTKDIGKDHFIFSESKEGYKPFLEGKNIERYAFKQYGWLNYNPNEHYNSMFPELFENEKLVFINVVKDRLRFAYDNNHFYNSHTVINCLKIDDMQSALHPSAKKIVKESDLDFVRNYSLKYILGITNSFLMNWYFVNFLSESLHFYPNDAKNLPIKTINFSKPISKSLHDNIVIFVDQMILTKNQLKTVKSEKEKEYLQRKCESLDRQIDNLVYNLYSLTEEEIDIIETIK